MEVGLGLPAVGPSPAAPSCSDWSSLPSPKQPSRELRSPPPVTHIRVIVHCGDQVLHQGLQRPGDEASFLEDEVPGATGPTSSLPHARLPLSTTAGPEYAGKDHGRLGHSFLGRKNEAVRHQRRLRQALLPGRPQLACRYTAKAPAGQGEESLDVGMGRRAGSPVAPKPLINVSDKCFFSTCSEHTKPHSRDLHTEIPASWGSIPVGKRKTPPGRGHQACGGWSRQPRGSGTETD